MLPILFWTYDRLARAEETEALEAFGDRYEAYCRTTARFIPGLNRGSN
jgi:protein-S-isoprenylcysteine O-methyltransferase Ste14